MSARTRAERRHNTAIIKARRNAEMLNTWGCSLEEGVPHYTVSGERRMMWRVGYQDEVSTRQNTVIDEGFEDVVRHHKSSRRVTPAKAKSARTPWRGRAGRDIYPGAEYCPIDTPWAIAHAAQVQAAMAAPVALEYDYYDPADHHVTGLSRGMLAFMSTPAYALGRWNLGYRDCDLAQFS